MGYSRTSLRTPDVQKFAEKLINIGNSEKKFCCKKINPRDETTTDIFCHEPFLLV